MSRQFIAIVTVTHCTMCIVCAAIPGKPIQTLILVTTSSVEISYEPSDDCDDSRAMKYRPKYREFGQTKWTSMPETSNSTQTFSGLAADSVYEFTASAKYQGGQWGPPSELLHVKTKRTAPGTTYSVLL